MENFLSEIEEYSKRLEEEKKNKGSDQTHSDDEFEEVSDNLIDNLHESREEIERLKIDLETERKKVKLLEDIIKNQKNNIDILKEKKEEEDNEQPKDKEGCHAKGNKRCRYWNRGFCREKSSCLFTHVKEDCESFQKEGSCYDRTCKKRHRKECRYYSKGNCFRGNICEYKHGRNNQIKETKKDKQQGSKSDCHDCEYCDYKCRNKDDMNNHMKTIHEDTSGSKYENIVQFIRRLGLDRFADQYENYFKESDFEKGKDCVEKLVLSYGEDCTSTLYKEAHCSYCGF